LKSGTARRASSFAIPSCINNVSIIITSVQYTQTNM
jgi:hypothetical protein